MRVIGRIIASLVQIGICVAAIRMVTLSSDTSESAIKIFMAIIMAVGFANLAVIAKEIVQYFYVSAVNHEMEGFYDQASYEELVEKEKKLRIVSLICDLFKKGTRAIFAIALGLLFIICGIYMGIIGDNGTVQNVMCMFIFPLMGLTAIIVFSGPAISIIKELIHVNDISWQEAGEKKEKKKRITMEQVKVYCFGGVFFLCGLLAFIEGIQFFVAHDIGQAIGMGFFGILFMAVGALLAYILGKKSS